MFVHPAQVAAVLARHPEVARGRLVISGRMAEDRMRLLVETGADAPDALLERIADSVREVTKLRCEVERRDTGQPAERRQGDRGQAALRLTAGRTGRRRGRVAGWHLSARC